MLFDALVTPSLKLANRIVMAPLTRSRAVDANTPNALMAEYYGQRATAGRFCFRVAKAFGLLKQCALRVAGRAGGKLSARPVTPALPTAAQIFRQWFLVRCRFL